MKVCHTRKRNISVSFCSIHSGEEYSEAIVMKHAFGQGIILNIMRLQKFLYSGWSTFSKYIPYYLWQFLGIWQYYVWIFSIFYIKLQNFDWTKLCRNLVYAIFSIALLVEVSISCLLLFPYTVLLLMICFSGTEMDILYSGKLTV